MLLLPKRLEQAVLSDSETKQRLERMAKKVNKYEYAFRFTEKDYTIQKDKQQHGDEHEETTMFDYQGQNPEDIHYVQIFTDQLQKKKPQRKSNS